MIAKEGKIHFIAVGGSVMHNLALALADQGYKVSGSDDQFFDPSKSRLAAKGLLPESEGWDANRISDDLDAVIVGMHAKEDNPELVAAKEKQLKIYSFPEFIYEQCSDKQRFVIGGSHGKTTITSMIMHVLKSLNKPFDYAVGAQLDGFDNMVKLTDDAPIAIIEGDEYLSSPLDPTPKFLKYHHHVGVISGIAWDHVNVFPTEAIYNEQFKKFADATPKAGTLIYNEEDKLVKEYSEAVTEDCYKFPYTTPKHEVRDGVTYISNDGKEYALQIFGEHNLSNLSAAWWVCKRMSVQDDQFLTAMTSFTGASKRLEKIGQNDSTTIFKDFAHSPSKLKATVAAVNNQFTNRELVAVMELHTFSSLNKDFLNEYKNAFSNIYKPIVFINPETFDHKGLEAFGADEIKAAFNNDAIIVVESAAELESIIEAENWSNKNCLIMTSGNLGNLDLDALTGKILK